MYKRSVPDLVNGMDHSNAVGIDAVNVACFSDLLACQNPNSHIDGFRLRYLSIFVENSVNFCFKPTVPPYSD